VHRAFALLAGLAATPPARGATLQAFHPAPGTGNFITTYGASIPAHGAWTAGAIGDHADDLLLGRGGVKLLDSRTSVHATGSLSLWRRLEFGVVMPLAVVQRGQDDLDGASAGDARLVPKLRGFWIGDDRRGFGGAFVAEVTFPTGNESRGHGEPFLTFAPRLALEVVRWGWAGALNLGLRVRESSGTGTREVDDEWIAGAALRSPAWAGLQATVDAYAFVGAAVDAGVSEPTVPAEVLGAVRYLRLPFGISVWAGGGVGLTAGTGASDFRAIGGVEVASLPPAVAPVTPRPSARPPVPVAPVLE
jgi:hypothetical protein